MNDDLSPTEPGPIDDGLLSRVLDGEATPDERALVESSPQGQARLAELRAAIDAVAAPVDPIRALATEALIGRALDTAVTPVVLGAEPTPPATSSPAPDEVTDRRRRTQRAGGWRRLGGVAAAVAAVVVLVVGVAALVQHRGRSSSDSASSDAVDNSGSARARASDEATSGAPEATPSELVPPDLGPLADAESVIERYVALLDVEPPIDHQFGGSESASTLADASQAPTSGAALPSTAACPVPPLTPATGEAWTVTATARLSEGAVLVMSNGLAPPANRVLVVDATSCTVLAERTL
jgi:hypothetical protein